ncbi:MAG: hypothetical protein M3383_03340 [Actinomycetota bacterium]|nr:hypothetical protein [Actinomycetota bacterium]
MNRTRKLLVGGALAMFAGIAVGCGGDSDEDPAEVLRESFSQNVDYESGVINIGLSGSLAGEQSGSIEADITGPFSGGGEGEQPEFQLDANVDVNAENLPDVPGGSFSFNFDGGMGLADDTLFVNYQDTNYAASDELYSQIEPLIAAASEAEETPEAEDDPDQFIDALSNLENEGTEDIDGESAIHVSGDLDFAALAESGAAEGSVPFDPAQLEGLDASVDVFVAEDDKAFRQLDFTFNADDVEQLSAQGIDGLDFTVSFGISDPNSEQEIAAPTDTQPLDDLLGQFGASEQQILEQIQGLSALGGLGAGGSLPPGGSGLPADPTDPEFQACVEAAGQDSAALAECFG